jgi:hypothetical protein
MDPTDGDRHSRIGRADVTESSKTTNQAVISRRTAIGGALGGALVTLLARPELATAEEGDRQPAALVPAVERSVSARGQWPRSRSVQGGSE